VKLSSQDRRLIELTQAGLPLVKEPYALIAQEMGEQTSWVQARLQTLLDAGVIRRIGAVPNHYRLGFVANGMSVWDVDDAQVDILGERIGALAGVSHCYRRPRHMPVWSYNLFAMLHGRSREEVQAQAQEIKLLIGSAYRQHDILYSSAILKKQVCVWSALATEQKVEAVCFVSRNICANWFLRTKG